MELTIITKMGDKELHVKGVTLKELLQIQTWGGYKNKGEWLRALNDDDPKAIQAAYGLAVWRDSGEKPRLDDLDFNTDTIDSRMVDETGQTVEIVFETNKDGSLKLRDGAPVPSLGKDGQLQFRYSESGELIPPTEAMPSTT